MRSTNLLTYLLTFSENFLVLYADVVSPLSEINMNELTNESVPGQLVAARRGNCYLRQIKRNSPDIEYAANFRLTAARSEH